MSKSLSFPRFWCLLQPSVVAACATVLLCWAAVTYMGGCSATPQQAQANLDAKAVAAEVAAALQNDPNVPEKTKAVAGKIGAAAGAAVSPTGEVTPESVASAVATAFPQYGIYGLLAAQVLRIVQAQINARKQNAVTVAASPKSTSPLPAA